MPFRAKLRIAGACGGWRRPTHSLAVGIVGLGALLFPVPAIAKVSCEDAGGGASADVAGLPREPVAGRTYTLSIPTEGRDAIRTRPDLVILDCSPGAPARSGGPLDDDSFRDFPAARGVEDETVAVDVRFPKPGRWAMTIFGLRPELRDLGMHRVLATSPSSAAGIDGGAGDASSGAAGSTFAAPALAALGALLLVGVTVRARASARSRRSASAG